jgi:hypothetical protein
MLTSCKRINNTTISAGLCWYILYNKAKIVTRLDENVRILQ